MGSPSFSSGPEIFLLPSHVGAVCLFLAVGPLHRTPSEQALLLGHVFTGVLRVQYCVRV